MFIGGGLLARGTLMGFFSRLALYPPAGGFAAGVLRAQDLAYKFK